jgi:hypothetical protein
LEHEIIESDIKFVRLTTGEDLISEMEFITVDDSSYYVLKNPMKILYIHNVKSMSISLMQWVFNKICDVQEFALFPSDILTTGIPNQSLVHYYTTSLKQYNSLRKIESSSDTEDDPEIIDQSEGFKMVEEMLNMISKKRTLH